MNSVTDAETLDRKTCIERWEKMTGEEIPKRLSIEFMRRALTYEQHCHVYGRLTLNMLLSFAQFEREVTAERIRDKIAASKRKGLWMGGKLLSRGNLHAILCNPVYIGMIRHKSVVHNGMHKAIIDTDAFDQVQQLMQQQSGKTRGMSTNSVQPSPLIGKLFDETGDRLTPSHSNKKGVRHRYYISHRLVAKKTMTNASKVRDGWRLPAAKLEAAIGRLIDQHLNSSKFRSNIIAGLDAGAAEQMMEGIHKLVTGVQTTPQLAASLIASVNLKPGEIRIALIAECLEKQLIGDRLGGKMNVQPQSLNTEEPILKITAAFQLRKRGQESKIIIGNETTEPERDTVLIRNIAKAHVWYQQIKHGRTFDQIADQENSSSATIRNNINLAFLAPDIVRQMLDGKQPIGLTSKYLLKHLPSPSWQKQRELFRTL